MTYLINNILLVSYSFRENLIFPHFLFLRYEILTLYDNLEINFSQHVHI